MNKTASSSKFGWRQINLHQQKTKSAFADWYQPT